MCFLKLLSSLSDRWTLQLKKQVEKRLRLASKTIVSTFQRSKLIILLLVLFGIAGALTVLKLINYVVYKIYAKYCRKKGKKSDKNQIRTNQILLEQQQSPNIPQRSTIIQVQSENLSSQHSWLNYQFLLNSQIFLFFL